MIIIRKGDINAGAGTSHEDWCPPLRFVCLEFELQHLAAVGREL